MQGDSVRHGLGGNDEFIHSLGGMHAGRSWVCAFGWGRGVSGQTHQALLALPPGGQVPNIAYIMSQKMGAILGQAMVMETCAGAGGTTAATLVAKAPKDGYTLLFGTSSMLGSAKFMNRDLAYDPVADFAPVAYLGNVTVGIFTSQKSGIGSIDSLISEARAKPGKLNFSSPGVGSVSHPAGELFKSRAKVEITHVPYQGLVAQITDLIGGQTEVALGGMRGYSAKRYAAICPCGKKP